LIAFAAALLGAAGCGGDEPPEFTAQEFVDAANERGGGIALGETLLGSQPGIETINALEFEHKGEERPPDTGHAHAAASLVVAQNEASAEEQHDRCEASVSFICLRAANVVVILQRETDAADVARLQAALVALSQE
jgi:hypothetical protein